MLTAIYGIKESLVATTFQHLGNESPQALSLKVHDVSRRRIEFDECQLYKGDQSDAIYLVLDGECVHVPNTKTYKNLFTSTASFITVSQENMNSCPKGEAIADGAILIQGDLSVEVYFMSRNSRRISNVKVFNQCNFDSTKIVALPQLIVSSLPKGPEILMGGIFHECKLYKGADSDAVYLLIYGVCHWIPNKQTYYNLFSSWDINIISETEMQSCSKGKNIENGAALIRDVTQSAVYLISHEARLIADPYTLKSCNFDVNKIVDLPESIIANLDKGTPIRVEEK